MVLREGYPALTEGAGDGRLPPVLRLGKWLVVLALVVMIGGHWALIQSAAWVRMAVKFSETEPIAVALEKTFNGKNPCELCQFVKKGKASEKKQDLQKLEAKFEFTLESGSCGLFPPRPIRHFAFASERVEARAYAPLAPPPKAA